MNQGIVAKKTDKGFGFIKQDGQAKDLFFHSSELQNVAFDDIQEGDAVTFDVGDSPKGPNAVNVNKV